MTVAELAIRLEGMAAALSPLDFGPALAKARGYIEKDTENAFRQSRAPDGNPWAALSPATLKRRRFPGKPILLQTERLMNEALDAIRRGQITATALTIVVEQPAYGPAHQTGTANMPDRKFLGLTLGTKMQIIQDAIDLVRDALLGRGYRQVA